MNIQISNMQLRNFKGVRNLNIDFNEITNITGDNGTGKTTVFDAFTWLLFGKNSGDAKDFNIKTLDKNNAPIHRLEHEITATLVIDGKDVKLRRLFKEKWVKKRGSETAEFTGHETEFFVDDVPLSQNEYKARVDFYINEDLAKLITSPLFFNQQMKWQDRRKVLEAMAGTITNEEIAADNKSFIELLAKLGDTSLIDFKKKIGAKKKIIKDNLETIPTRIDEAQRSFPEAQDYETIEIKISEKQKEIQNIDQAIEDKSKLFEKEFEIIRNDQQKLNNLKIQLGQAETKNLGSKKNSLADIDGRIQALETGLRNDRSLYSSNKKDILQHKTKIETLNNDNAKLRQQWNAENAKELVIDEHKYNCPTCKQLLPEEERENMKETLTANFNTNKAAKLKEITETGKNNGTKIAELEITIKSLDDANALIESRIAKSEIELTGLQDQRTSINSAIITPSKEEMDLKNRIAEFKIAESPKIDNTELKNKKAVISSDIDSLKTVLASKDQIEKTKARIKELEAEEKKLSQELADLERTEFTLDAFSKAKIETIESRINGKFKLVAFKMFEQQINGGEIECCECMVNGVPYSDTNTASKINAGIDIINALTQHYGVNAPVWIDNRESVIRILPCKSQIINLVAMKDKPLTIKAHAMEMAETN